MAKRGLLVSYYFPPTGGGGVQRWVKTIKYLADYGWEFCVIANEYTQSSPKDESLLDEIPDNIKIIRTQNSSRVESIQKKAPVFKQSGYWQRWTSAFFRITDSRGSWNTIAEKNINDELEKYHYDVIIFTSPPYSLAFLAAEITDKINCPVILDLRDPWSINPYKIYPTIFHRLFDKHREKSAISKIDFLISAYSSTIEDYRIRIKNFDSKKTLILPNSYDESDFLELSNVKSFQGGKFNIGFSGSLYSHLNTPDPIFMAMSRLINDGLDIHFHHIGASVYDLAKLAKKYKIEENVHCWGYYDHKKSLEFLKMMDILCLILDDRLPNSQNTVGGKLYEYLRLRKPIFAVIPEKGEAAAIINKTNSGKVVSAKDNEKVTEELKSLIINKHDYTWEGIEEYTREKQAKILNSYLEKYI